MVRRTGPPRPPAEGGCSLRRGPSTTPGSCPSGPGWCLRPLGGVLVSVCLFVLLPTQAAGQDLEGTESSTRQYRAAENGSSLPSDHRHQPASSPDPSSTWDHPPTSSLGSSSRLPSETSDIVDPSAAAGMTSTMGASSRLLPHDSALASSTTPALTDPPASVTTTPAEPESSSDAGSVSAPNLSDRITTATEANPSTGTISVPNSSPFNSVTTSSDPDSSYRTNSVPRSDFSSTTTASSKSSALQESEHGSAVVPSSSESDAVTSEPGTRSGSPEPQHSSTSSPSDFESISSDPDISSSLFTPTASDAMRTSDSSSASGFMDLSASSPYRPISTSDTTVVTSTVDTEEESSSAAYVERSTVDSTSDSVLSITNTPDSISVMQSVYSQSAVHPSTGSSELPFSGSASLTGTLESLSSVSVSVIGSLESPPAASVLDTSSADEAVPDTPTHTASLFPSSYSTGGLIGSDASALVSSDIVPSQSASVDGSYIFWSGSMNTLSSSDQSVSSLAHSAQTVSTEPTDATEASSNLAGLTFTSTNQFVTTLMTPSDQLHSTVTSVDTSVYISFPNSESQFSTQSSTDVSIFPTSISSVSYTQQTTLLSSGLDTGDSIASTADFYSPSSAASGLSLKSTMTTDSLGDTTPTPSLPSDFIESSSVMSLSTAPLSSSSRMIVTESSSSVETVSDSITETISPSVSAAFSSEPFQTTGASSGDSLTFSVTAPLPTPTPFFSTESYSAESSVSVFASKSLSSSFPHTTDRETLLESDSVSLTNTFTTRSDSVIRSESPETSSTDRSDITASSSTVSIPDSVSFYSSVFESSDFVTVSESQSPDSNSRGSDIVSSTEIAGESVYPTDSSSDFISIYPGSSTSSRHVISSTAAFFSMASSTLIPDYESSSSSSSETVMPSSETVSMSVESSLPSTGAGSAYFSDLSSEHTPFSSAEFDSLTSVTFSTRTPTIPSSVMSTQGVSATPTVTVPTGSIDVSDLDSSIKITPTESLDASDFRTTNGFVSTDSASSSGVISASFISPTQSQPVSEARSTSEVYLTNSINASVITESISVSEVSSTVDVALTPSVSRETSLVSDVSDTFSEGVFSSVTSSTGFATVFPETSSASPHFVTTMSVTAEWSELSSFSSSKSTELLPSSESRLPSTGVMSFSSSGETISLSTQSISASSFGQSLLSSGAMSSLASSEIPASLYTMTTLLEVSTDIASTSGDSITPTVVSSTETFLSFSSQTASTESVNVSGILTRTEFVPSESTHGSKASSTLYISPTKTESTSETIFTAEIYPTITANVSDFGSSVDMITTQSMFSANETEASDSISSTVTAILSSGSSVGEVSFTIDFTSTASMTLPSSSYSFLSGTFSTSELVSVVVPSQTFTPSSAVQSSFPQTESYTMHISETTMHSVSESLETFHSQPTLFTSHFSSGHTLVPTSTPSSELSLSLVSSSSIDSTITTPVQSSNFDFSTSPPFSAVSFSSVVPEFSQSEDIFSSYFSQSGEDVSPTVATVPSLSVTSDLEFSSQFPSTILSGYSPSTYSPASSESLSTFNSYSQSLIISSAAPPTATTPAQSSATYSDLTSVPSSQLSSDSPLFSTMEMSSLGTPATDMSTVTQTSVVASENTSVVATTVSAFSSVDLSSSPIVSSLSLTESLPKSAVTEFQTPYISSLPYETTVTSAFGSLTVSTTEQETRSSIFGSESVYLSSHLSVTSTALPTPSSTLPSSFFSTPSFSSVIVSGPSFSSDAVFSVTLTSSIASSDAFSASTSLDSVIITAPSISISEAVTHFPSTNETSWISALTSAEASTYSDLLSSSESGSVLTSSEDVSETSMPLSETSVTGIQTSALPSDSVIVTEQSTSSSMTESMLPSLTLQTSTSVVDSTVMPGTTTLVSVASDILGTSSVEASFTTPGLTPPVTPSVPSTMGTLSSTLMTSIEPSTAATLSSTLMTSSVPSTETAVSSTSMASSLPSTVAPVSSMLMTSSVSSTETTVPSTLMTSSVPSTETAVSSTSMASSLPSTVAPVSSMLMTSSVSSTETTVPSTLMTSSVPSTETAVSSTSMASSLPSTVAPVSSMLMTSSVSSTETTVPSTLMTSSVPSTETTVSSTLVTSTAATLSSTLMTSSVPSTETAISSTSMASSVPSTETTVLSMLVTSSVSSTETTVSSTLTTSSVLSTETTASSMLITSSMLSTVAPVSSTLMTSSVSSPETTDSSTLMTSSVPSTETTVSSMLVTSSVSSTAATLSSTLMTSSVTSTETAVSSTSMASSVPSTETTVSSMLVTSSVSSTETTVSSTLMTSSVPSTETTASSMLITSSMLSTVAPVSSTLMTSSVPSMETTVSSPLTTSSLSSVVGTVSSPLMTSDLESSSSELTSMEIVMTTVLDGSSSGVISSSPVSFSSSSVMISGLSSFLATQTSIIQPSSSETVSTSAMPTTSQISPTTASTTVEPTTSATITTPPVTASKTTPVPDRFLVVTVIRLQATDDISSPAFITEMERGLAEAYDIAFKRQSAGGLSPSRRKRFAALLSSLRVPALNYKRHRRAVVNDVEVKISNVTKEASNPSNAGLTHSVTKAGQVVPASEAADSLDSLLDQELALELNRFVVIKAKPVSQTQTSAPPVSPTDDGDQLWIIGAVLGPLALIVVIWLLVCLLVRHRESKKAKLRIDGAQSGISGQNYADSGSSNQPHLLTVKHGGSTKSETADETTHTDDSPGPSNGHPKGLLKTSPSKKKDRVNIDTSTSVTSADAEATVRASKKGRKLPKKRGSLVNGGVEQTEGDDSSEKEISQKSTPSKRQSSRRLSVKQTDEMEMNPLDPGFYNTNMMQTTQQLYSQQTFEEEEDEFVENVEEERRKNKMRQRLKKKQDKTVATQPLSTDPTQAAYERAQQEIDKVLGPRQPFTATSASDVAAGKKERRRSKQRSKKGQANEGFTSETEHPAQSASGLPPSESLDEMKSRVHALLDDAFSLLSNSYSSIGLAVSERSRSFRSNRVSPETPTKSTTATNVENAAPHERSAEQGVMPEVEEIRGMGVAPKPGEKLHTPLHVERTHGNYDTGGLITWSPYRASDESARIVLPERQPSDTKAPAQEKIHTTTFNELSAGNIKAEGYHATQPGQSIVIRTQKSAESSQPKVSNASQKTKDNKDTVAETDAQQMGATGDTEIEYTSYPGLEAYQQLLSETNTTTAHFTASNTAQRRGSSGAPVLHRQTSDSREEHHAPRSTGILSVVDKKPREINGEDSGPRDTTSDLPPKHRPPSRNVGSTDEKDIIASSLRNGSSTSAKDLVDSIRQELQSLSTKMITDANTGSSKAPIGKVANGLDSKSEIKSQVVPASENSKGHRAADSKDSTRKGLVAADIKDTYESANTSGRDTSEINDVAGRLRKPMKKPRRAFESN